MPGQAKSPCLPTNLPRAFGAIQGTTWLSRFIPASPSHPIQGGEAHLTDPWLGLNVELFFRDHHEHGWVGEGRALQLAQLIRLIPVVSVHFDLRVDKVVIDEPAHLARAEVPRQQVALGGRHPGIRPRGLRRQRGRELEHSNVALLTDASRARTDRAQASGGTILTEVKWSFC